MARTKKAERTAENILKEIGSVESLIAKTTDRLTDLRKQLKSLQKELTEVQERESRAQEEQQMKDLAALLKERGLSVEQLTEIINEKNRAEEY